MNIFRLRTGIEKQVEEFLDQVSLSGLIFKPTGRVRRSINEHLSKKIFIQESRGDVWEFLENMDPLLGHRPECADEDSFDLGNLPDSFSLLRHLSV